MLSLREAATTTNTRSARSLRSALGSDRASVRKLLQTNVIHRHYLNTGGRNGVLEFPTPEVHTSGATAPRAYRGGEIQLPDTGQTLGLITRQVSVRFLGFRYIKESVPVVIAGARRTVVS